MQGLMLSGPMALVGSREDRDSYISASLSSREEIVLLDWIGVRGPVPIRGREKQLRTKTELKN